LTLDDILRDEIRQNTTFRDYSISVKISAAFTTIILVAGSINSALAFLTFQNREARRVGCGMYLLASSVTSLLTIFMLSVKFWFLILTQTNASINLTVLYIGCIVIEPTLKLFLYLDGWLNACVAIERAIALARGVNFDTKKSKHIARWIILFLPLIVASSIIYEPLNRELFDDKEMHMVWCVTRYSSAVQYYNILILLFHFFGPTVANLFSALFIIFGTIRRRSKIHAERTFIEQIRRQLRDHKQILISPITLVLISLPRLIISLLSGCIDVSRHSWFYLSGYFISFIPSVTVFIVFVLPSGSYKRLFRESIKRWRRRMHRQ
jgi:hypothetical protein